MGSIDTHPQAPLRIAIIGGGIGGLTLALGLQQYDHLDVHVYESKSKFAETGAAISMLPNAIWALRLTSPAAIEAAERCLTGSADQQSAEEPPRIYAGTGPEAGRFLGHMLPSGTAEEGCVKNVHRATFLAELACRLKRPQNAHLGAKVVRVEDRSAEGGRVLIRFADGSFETVDAVIGADGIHSAVRKALFEEGSLYDTPVFSQETTHRGLVSMEEAIAVMGRTRAEHPSFTMGPGTILFNHTTDLGRKVNVVAKSLHAGPWKEESWILPGTRRELEAILGQWGDIGRQYIELLDKPGLSKWAIHESPPLPYYSRDCVALTGGAAHSMNPTAGSGAGMAFEDMAVLTALFQHVHTPSQIPKALTAYDLVRRARAQMAVRTATEMLMKGTFAWPGTGNGNVVERLTGAMRSIVCRDVGRMVGEAVVVMREA